MDILVVLLLCLLNRTIAKRKGNNSLFYVLLTVILSLMIPLFIMVGYTSYKVIGMVNTLTGDSETMLQTMLDVVMPVTTKIELIGLGVGGVLSVLLTLFTNKKARPVMRNNPGMQGNPYMNPQNDPYMNQPGQGMNAGYGGQPVNPYQNQGANGYGHLNQNPYGGQPFYGGQNPYGGQAPYGVPGPGMYQGQPASYMGNPGFNQPFTYDFADGDGDRLSTPCTVCIVREQSSISAQEVFTFSLNGHKACQLPNGGSMSLMTNALQNTITARNGFGASLKRPIQFTAVPGGYVEIHAKGDQFLPDKTVGLRPSDGDESNI